MVDEKEESCVEDADGTEFGRQVLAQVAQVKKGLDIND
jgi:hypothetical protein